MIPHTKHSLLTALRCTALMAVMQANSTALKYQWWVLIVGLVLLGSLRFLWLEDAPFIHDEPQLIQIAMDDAASGTATKLGLTGSRGFRYGPTVIWMYRGALALVLSILQILGFKVFLISILTGR